MSSLWYDLSFVKDSFKFLFLENKKIFCDLNFLSLPFYFGKNKKFLKYYRFESSIINYTKLKNSSSFYLIFKLHATSSLKVRSDNLFETSCFSLSTIFKSKKYYGYLLENNLGQNSHLISLISSNQYYFNKSSHLSSVNDYFSVTGFNYNYFSLFSDPFNYFSLFYNRFHRKYQNSSFDIDLFISSYVTDSRRIFSGSFWDVCSKFFIIDTKMNLRSFFVNSNLHSSGKYFSYFFLGHFVKKIVYKLKVSGLKFLFKPSLFNGYFYFILNSFLNKLDDFFFFYFNKLIFLNFFYKFLNFFGFSNQFFIFLGDYALTLLNKVFVFWSIYYLLNKFLVLNSFFIFFFRYIFIILMNLFFVSIFNAYSSSNFVKKVAVSRLYSKVVSTSILKLSKKIYFTKSLLKITFKKHAVLLFDYLNFSGNSAITKVYFSPKRISPKLHYTDSIHLKVKTFLIKFRGIFLCFFRRNFFFDTFIHDSLIHFRFFVSNFFFKTKVFRFKESFWNDFMCINKKFLGKLFFFFRKKLFLKKSFYLKKLLRLFQFYKTNRIFSCLNWKLHRKFISNLNINKHKSFGMNLFNLKANLRQKGIVLEKKLLPSELSSYIGTSFILLYLIFYITNSKIFFYDIPSLRLSSKSRSFYRISLLKKNNRFYTDFALKTTFNVKYLNANLDFFCETFFKNLSLDLLNSICLSWRSGDFSPTTYPIYLFYFFCYFFLLDLLQFNSTIDSLFLSKSFSFFAISFTDLRFFVYITLLLDSFYIKDFNTFFNFKARFIHKFSKFILKVDFFTFMFIGEYVEYFRVFKYNEYIMSSIALDVDSFKSRFFLQRYPKLHLTRSYLKLKEYSFFHFYNIYKIYFTFTSAFSYNKSLIYRSFAGFSFTKFFYIFFRLKNLLWIFSKIFYGYFVSSILFYSYKSLVALPALFDVQNLPAETFFDLTTNIDFFSKSFDVSVEGSLVCLFFFRLRSNFFSDYFVSNLFFLDQLTFLFKDSTPVSLQWSTDFFFYTLSRLLLLDYMDGLFFDSILEIQNYTILKLLDIVLFWLRWSYLSFVQLPDYYQDLNYLNFFSYFKYSLDYLIWNIFNFSSFNNVSFLFSDINLLLNKFNFDSNIASFHKTVNLFLFLFFSVMYNFSGYISPTIGEKFPQVLDLNFVFISLGFFVYFFLRDLFFNIFCFFLNSVFVLNPCIKSSFTYFFFSLQFNYVSFVFYRFFYFSNFKRFTVRLTNGDDFSYHVYV